MTETNNNSFPARINPPEVGLHNDIRLVHQNELVNRGTTERAELATEAAHISGSHIDFRPTRKSILLNDKIVSMGDQKVAVIMAAPLRDKPVAEEELEVPALKITTDVTTLSGAQKEVTRVIQMQRADHRDRLSPAYHFTHKDVKATKAMIKELREAKEAGLLGNLADDFSHIKVDPASRN